MSDKSYKTEITNLENYIINSYFNKQGNLIKIEKFNKDSKDSKNQKLSEVTFAEDGRTIKEQIQYEYSNDNTKKPFKKTIYNSKNTTTIEDYKNNTITEETHYPNGNIKERIIKDKTTDTILCKREFGKNGVCISDTTYEKGQQTFKREFDKNGVCISETTYENGQQTFKREFHNNGKTVKKLETYENGKRIKSELFDEQSKKIQEDTYHSFDGNKVQKSTLYDADTGREIEDKYFDPLCNLNKTIKYIGNTKRIDNYNANNKIEKTEIINTEDNSREELIYDDKGKVKQITKFYPNNEKDVEIFFDNNGKIDKLKTYYENKCNREYSFQNINDFNRDEFLSLSTTERENLLDQLIERNTKCCTEYSKNGQKVIETFYRENGETVEKVIEYDVDGKKNVETFFKKDGETIEKTIKYGENGNEIKSTKEELNVLIDAINELPTQKQSKTTISPLN